ncbi:hypothetical protein [Bacillus phage SBSphiJ6]|nr:hypothetical protein [Bacillus phage SBSphiJ1]UPI12206.1 hypothetical protein [Bacillus phage SBSphiJ2]UPI12708.1 hypothetical protein [Bacillus phage SBSphiJ4]UPI13200.1 hypothetical protein [Bacillus phage SBSphiJ6]
MRKTTKLQLMYTGMLTAAALLFHVTYYLVTGEVKENAVVPNIICIVVYYIAMGAGLHEGRAIGYNECVENLEKFQKEINLSGWSGYYGKNKTD